MAANLFRQRSQEGSARSSSPAVDVAFGCPACRRGAFLILPWFTKFPIPPDDESQPVAGSGRHALDRHAVEKRGTRWGLHLALLAGAAPRQILRGFNAQTRLHVVVVAYLMVNKALEWKDAPPLKAAQYRWWFIPRPLATARLHHA